MANARRTVRQGETGKRSSEGLIPKGHLDPAPLQGGGEFDSEDDSQFVSGDAAPGYDPPEPILEGRPEKRVLNPNSWRMVEVPEAPLEIYSGKKEERVVPDVGTKGTNLFYRIQAVMKEVEYIQKAQPTGNLKYSILLSSTVLREVRPAMLRAGIVIIPGEITRFESKEIKVGSNTNTLIDICQKFRFQNIDDPDDYVIGESAGSGCDPTDKALSKAITMTEKNMIVKTFMIESGDDHPDDRPNEDPGADADIEYAHPDDVAFLRDLARKARVDEAVICKSIGCNSLDDMQAKDFQMIVDKLNSKMANSGANRNAPERA